MVRNLPETTPKPSRENGVSHEQPNPSKHQKNGKKNDGVQWWRESGPLITPTSARALSSHALGTNVPLCDT